jgi:hypothetical protein
MKSSDIIAALAALASWVALWINVRITRDSKKTLVQASWDDARTYRIKFWPIVRAAYASFRTPRTAVLPEDLDALVGGTGMPPNVLIKKDRNLRSWFDDYGARLSTDQRNLWEFVSAIYPPRTGGTPDVMEGSIIPDGDKESFHRSRQVLGAFFQRGRERLSNRVLDAIAGHADDDVFLVSWLELALVRGTRDDGPGKKSKLFEFGNYLWNRQR